MRPSRGGAVAARRARDGLGDSSWSPCERRVCARALGVNSGSGCIFPNSVLRFVYEYKDSLDVYRLCFSVLARAVAAVVVSRGGTRRRHGGGSHERGACARGDVTRAFVSLGLFRGVSRANARARERSRSSMGAREGFRARRLDRSIARREGRARGTGNDGGDGADVGGVSAVKSRGRRRRRVD